MEKKEFKTVKESQCIPSESITAQHTLMVVEIWCKKKMVHKKKNKGKKPSIRSVRIDKMVEINWLIKKKRIYKEAEWD